MGGRSESFRLDTRVKAQTRSPCIDGEAVRWAPRAAWRCGQDFCRGVLSRGEGKSTWQGASQESSMEGRVNSGVHDCVRVLFEGGEGGSRGHGGDLGQQNTGPSFAGRTYFRERQV